MGTTRHFTPLYFGDWEYEKTDDDNDKANQARQDSLHQPGYHLTGNNYIGYRGVVYKKSKKYKDNSSETGRRIKEHFGRE